MKALDIRIKAISLSTIQKKTVTLENWHILGPSARLLRKFSVDPTAYPIFAQHFYLLHYRIIYDTKKP